MSEVHPIIKLSPRAGRCLCSPAHHGVRFRGDQSVVRRGSNRIVVTIVDSVDNS